eukprot:ANDGO_06665.mRNA.1 hypothetical protein
MSSMSIVNVICQPPVFQRVASFLSLEVDGYALHLVNSSFLDLFAQNVCYFWIDEPVSLLRFDALSKLVLSRPFIPRGTAGWIKLRTIPILRYLHRDSLQHEDGLLQSIIDGAALISHISFFCELSTDDAARKRQLQSLVLPPVLARDLPAGCQIVFKNVYFADTVELLVALWPRHFRLVFHIDPATAIRESGLEATRRLFTDTIPKIVRMRRHVLFVASLGWSSNIPSLSRTSSSSLLNNNSGALQTEAETDFSFVHRLLPFGVVFLQLVMSVNRESQMGFSLAGRIHALALESADALDGMLLEDPPFRSGEAVANAMNSMYDPTPHVDDMNVRIHRTAAFDQFVVLDGIRGSLDVQDLRTVHAVYQQNLELLLTQQISSEEGDLHVDQGSSKMVSFRPMTVDLHNDASITVLHSFLCQPLVLQNLNCLKGLLIFRNTEERSIIPKSMRHVVVRYDLDLNSLPSLEYLVYDVPSVRDHGFEWWFDDFREADEDPSGERQLVLDSPQAILQVRNCRFLLYVRTTALLFVENCPNISGISTNGTCCFLGRVAGRLLRPVSLLQNCFLNCSQQLGRQLPCLQSLSCAVPRGCSFISLMDTRISQLNLFGSSFDRVKSTVFIQSATPVAVTCTQLEAVLLDELSWMYIGRHAVHSSVNRLDLVQRLPSKKPVGIVDEKTFSRVRASLPPPLLPHACKLFLRDRFVVYDGMLFCGGVPPESDPKASASLQNVAYSTVVYIQAPPTSTISVDETILGNSADVYFIVNAKLEAVNIKLNSPFVTKLHVSPRARILLESYDALTTVSYHGDCAPGTVTIPPFGDLLRDNAVPLLPSLKHIVFDSESQIPTNQQLHLRSDQKVHCSGAALHFPSLFLHVADNGPDSAL